jgi:hypothetical protein
MLSNVINEIRSTLVNSGTYVVSSRVEQEDGTWLHFEVFRAPLTTHEEPAGCEVLRMAGLLHVFPYGTGSRITIAGKLDTSTDPHGSQEAVRAALVEVLPLAGFEVLSTSVVINRGILSGTVKLRLEMADYYGGHHPARDVLESLGLYGVTQCEAFGCIGGAEVILFWTAGLVEAT